MTYSHSILGKEVAWNGIRFLSPADWEIGKIGNQYLMLEDDEGPVMEVKWRRIKGNFSPQTQLQRLAALHKKKIGVTIKKIPIPSNWEKMAEHYQTVCFSWHNEVMGGIGIVLYCPKCQTSTLMQFFQRKARKTEKITTHLLASFQDHPKKGQTAWTVFDMTARIPDDFQLLRYRFEPGVFELTFARGKHKITLYRWGPATILLRELDLLQTASKMFGISQGNLQHKKIDDYDTIDTNICPRSDGWTRIRRLVKPNHVYCMARLWHLEDKNRLHGVKMDGKQPTDLLMFEQVCRNFNSL